MSSSNVAGKRVTVKELFKKMKEIKSSLPPKKPKNKNPVKKLSETKLKAIKKSKRHPKPPKIITKSRIDNIRTVIDLIKSKCGGYHDFFVEQTSKSILTINPLKNGVHAKIVELLKDNNYEFLTSPPKVVRPILIVLKGVGTAHTEKRVARAIKKLDVPDVTVRKISKYIFDRNTPEKFHFLLELTPDSKWKNFRHTKLLLNKSVRWEKLRKITILQCKKCQKVGHVATNCNSEFKCAKCAEAHDTILCPLLEIIEKSQLKCVNCGESGHPASYKGCTYIKEALRQKKEAKAYIKPEKPSESTVDLRPSANKEASDPTADLKEIHQQLAKLKLKKNKARGKKTRRNH